MAKEKWGWRRNRRLVSTCTASQTIRRLARCGGVSRICKRFKRGARLEVEAKTHASTRLQGLVTAGDAWANSICGEHKRQTCEMDGLAEHGVPPGPSYRCGGRIVSKKTCYWKTNSWLPPVQKAKDAPLALSAKRRRRTPSRMGRLSDSGQKEYQHRRLDRQAVYGRHHMPKQYRRPNSFEARLKVAGVKMQRSMQRSIAKAEQEDRAIELAPGLSLSSIRFFSRFLRVECDTRTTMICKLARASAHYLIHV